MDHELTEKLGRWLEAPEAERDYAAGALYLLRLSGNRILYRNVRAAATADVRAVIVRQLRKYYDFRVQALTHAQVGEMAAQVERIAEARSLDGPAGASEEADAKRLGKRDEHDSLPLEIQAKYRENYSLLARMRELHLRLRTLSLEDSTCPDSERWPFLKELIALDKRLHANWEEYDRYAPGGGGTEAKGKARASAGKKKPAAGKQAADKPQAPNNKR